MSELVGSKVAVLGAGIMGSGIAQLSAMAGYEAVARDVDERQLAAAKASTDRSLARLIKAGTARSSTGQRSASALAGHIRSRWKARFEGHSASMCDLDRSPLGASELVQHRQAGDAERLRGLVEAGA